MIIIWLGKKKKLIHALKIRKFSNNQAPTRKEMKWAKQNKNTKRSWPTRRGGVRGSPALIQ